MTHRRIRDRVEDELFGRLAPKEENDDMAQTKRTRRIVDAAKGLLMEEPGLTAAELHDRLSRNGASLPLVKSFAPYVTQARKELGIDGRKAVAGHAQDPQGEDPAGDDSEAGANSPTPAPPAEEETDTPVTSLQGRKEIREATPERPSNEAQAKLKRASDDARNGGATRRPPSIDRLYFKAHRLEDGRYQIDASGPLPTIQRMVAALAGEGRER